MLPTNPNQHREKLQAKHTTNVRPSLNTQQSTPQPYHHLNPPQGIDK
ncbi:hypothetical protein E2C01_087836 [Portunus trituberculatus]|uniref:Uncharacterized protein n=1 Tax=Portunus trituberculatus TaxID=210409 RepID=A0A5B7J7P5_PORTR|nr:hypothetical protein [Portunus trituberculatus]